MAGDDTMSAQEANGSVSGELRTAVYPKRDALHAECDLVMKGGITSGVVYPLAVCELARTYRLRSVGGSSAGAIAAAFAAAAEYGRDDGGFERLAALPQEIAPRLPDLLQPTEHTRVAHEMVMASVEPDASTMTKLRRILSTAVGAQRRWFWLTFVLAALVPAGLALLAASGQLSGWRFVPLVLLLLLIAVVAFALAIATALGQEGRTTWGALGQQGFGIYMGSAGAANHDGDHGAAGGNPSTPDQLTDWLAARIDSVAGVDAPLTFGDLAPIGVDLKVTTTNLTYGRPVTFPFPRDGFLFDPIELGRYFPPDVIKGLVGERPPATRDGEVLRSPEGAELYAWPEAADTPVVVAVRLSLSFPGLISAVPLYAIDYSRTHEADQRPVRCWFSDGGITSNFPVHFFDSLWPRRPTFTLDLGPYHPDRPEQDVYYGGYRDREPRVQPIEGMSSFLGSILDTMQYWSDNTQAALAGYRDRIVEVHLRDNEGGMNLRMPDETVLSVARKGRAAAAELVAAFDFDHHRWVRYLTAMSELEAVVALMNERYPGPLPGAASGYRELIGGAPDRTLHTRDAQWVVDAQRRTETLLNFAASGAPDFTEWSAGPPTVLRITPDL